MENLKNCSYGQNAMCYSNSDCSCCPSFPPNLEEFWELMEEIEDLEGEILDVR